MTILDHYNSNNLKRLSEAPRKMRLENAFQNNMLLTLSIIASEKGVQCGVCGPRKIASSTEQSDLGLHYNFFWRGFLNKLNLYEQERQLHTVLC